MQNHTWTTLLLVSRTVVSRLQLELLGSEFLQPQTFLAWAPAATVPWHVPWCEAEREAAWLLSSIRGAMQWSFQCSTSRLRALVGEFPRMAPARGHRRPLEDRHLSSHMPISWVEPHSPTARFPFAGPTLSAFLCEGRQQLPPPYWQAQEHCVCRAWCTPPLSDGSCLLPPTCLTVKHDFGAEILHPEY